MLHKSFKPAKCKTALKLAVSRIKLLKNKRDAQVKQLKRELAQLLDSGQDQTARIRVEHVVREEKTMAAYDLIEIYCELIVARLPIIESQKYCPIDLKEAISSVIFASPRCADVPDLMDVRKHFTAKYGKEFVSAAVELRPDCGVSRLLVEKLSTKAPDGPTKIKILSAIAEEQNIKWDPKSFGEIEMKPPEDLLNGPNTFEQSSKLSTQELPNSVDRGPPNLGAPTKHYEKHDAHVNSYGTNSILSPQSQTFPSTATDPNKAMPSGTSHPDPRPFGTGSEATEFRHSHSSERSSFSAGRQGWNMEFKDATAAAQAAAESAELASLAARAAAELSSQGRISRQHSSESAKASAFRSKDEGLQNHANSRFQGQSLGQVPVNNTSHRSDSGMHLEQSFENEQDDLAGLAERFYNLKSSNKSGQSASLKSSSSSMIGRPRVSDMADGHHRKASNELEKRDHFGEVNLRTESSESEVEFEEHNEQKSENFGYFEEAGIRKQSTNGSSHSHSRVLSDEHNVFSSFSPQKFTEEAAEEPFIFYEGKIQKDSNDTNSYHNPDAIFDDFGSDDEELKFDVKGEYNDQDSSSYYFSDGRQPSSHLLASTSAKSPRLSMQESLRNSSSQSPFASNSHSPSVFSEGLVSDIVPSQADDLLPVNFDDSDAPSSESEGELDESKLVSKKRTGTFSHDGIAYLSNPEKTQNGNTHLVGSSLAEKENVGSYGKTRVQPSAVDLDIQVHSKRKQEIDYGAETETDRKSGYGYLHTNQASCILAKSQSNSNHNANSLSSVKEDIQNYQSLDIVEDSEPIIDSNLEIGQELNFGILTGGLRNKGYRRPPYRRNASNSSSVSSQVEKDNSTRIEQPSSSPKVDIGSGARDQESYNQLVHQKVNKKAISETAAPYSDAIDHESDEELPQQSLANSQEPDVHKIGSEGNKKSGLSYFYSDKSESEEDLAKETITSKTRLGPPLSRRTKTPLSSSGRNSSSKSRVPFKSSATADYVVEQKPSSVSSYATETQVKSPSQTKNSYYQQSFEQGKSSEQTSSKPVLQYKRSVHEQSSSKSSYPSDTRQKHPSPSKNSEYWERSEQRKLAESSKLNAESRRSSWEENLKSLAREQPSNLPPRRVASGGAESTKTSNSSADPPSRESSINKASHVHPKLPDYDTLTAHLLSLRQNRQ